MSVSLLLCNCAFTIFITAPPPYQEKKQLTECHWALTFPAGVACRVVSASGTQLAKAVRLEYQLSGLGTRPHLGGSWEHCNLVPWPLWHCPLPCFHSFLDRAALLLSALIFLTRSQLSVD